MVQWNPYFLRSLISGSPSSNIYFLRFPIITVEYPQFKVILIFTIKYILYNIQYIYIAYTKTLILGFHSITESWDEWLLGIMLEFWGTTLFQLPSPVTTLTFTFNGTFTVPPTTKVLFSQVNLHLRTMLLTNHITFSVLCQLYHVTHTATEPHITQIADVSSHHISTNHKHNLNHLPSL